MSYVGRAIGLFILCMLVGLFLETIGITAHDFLTDTRHTLGELLHKTGDLVAWALPRALLGAVIVVPLALVSLIGRRRRR